MSHTNQNNSIVSLPLLIIATAMVALGGIAIYDPQTLQQYMPHQYMDYFSQYSWLATAFCVAGLSLHVMVLLIKLTRPTSTMVKSFKDLDVQQDCPTMQQPVTGPVKVVKTSVSRFYNTKLVRKDSDIIKVKTTATSLFFLILLLLGSIATGAMLCMQMMEFRSFNDVLVAALVSGCFFLLGLFSLYKFAQPMVFDRQSGYFWHGYVGSRTPNMVLKNAKPLTRIHALQVLAGKSRSSGYELNLVLTDRSRINLMEHICPRTLNVNARRLSEFLGVPVWE